jgi:hypothetical protein
MNKKTPKNDDGTLLKSTDLLALLSKWEYKVTQLKGNAAWQLDIPKSIINSEIKGIRMCKKHLKEVLQANVKLNRREANQK